MVKHIVPIFVSIDLERTYKFYSDILGFVADGKHDDYLMIKNGDIEIHFSKLPCIDKKLNYCSCYIGVDNLDELYKKCLQVNCVHPDGKLSTLPWGREFAIIDPDYNLVKLAD